MPGRESSIQVTNDGATILRSIGVDNPVAKILVGKLFQMIFYVTFPLQIIKFEITKFLLLDILIDLSKVQDDEVGDGTTSVTVLASELLRVNKFISKPLSLEIFDLLIYHACYNNYK